jgi:hypothetical protein
MSLSFQCFSPNENCILRIQMQHEFLRHQEEADESLRVALKMTYLESLNNTITGKI